MNRLKTELGERTPGTSPYNLAALFMGGVLTALIHQRAHVGSPDVAIAQAYRDHGLLPLWDLYMPPEVWTVRHRGGGYSAWTSSEPIGVFTTSARAYAELIRLADTRHVYIPEAMRGEPMTFSLAVEDGGFPLWCKAHVKQYEKRAESGELVQVKEHEDKRPAAKTPEPGDTYDRDPYAKQAVERDRAAQGRAELTVQAARQPVPVVHGTTEGATGAGAKAAPEQKKQKPKQDTPQAPRFRDMLKKPKEGMATKIDGLVKLARENGMNEAMFQYHDWASCFFCTWYDRRRYRRRGEGCP